MMPGLTWCTALMRHIIAVEIYEQHVSGGDLKLSS